MRVWTSVLGLLWCCQLSVGTAEQAPVPLRRLGSGALVVPVSLGEGPPRPFLLDTGASSSVVADDVADALRLPRGGYAALATVGRVGVMSRALVARAAVGGHTATNLTVLLTTRRALAVHGAVDGILGLDVLAGRAFTLDLRRARMIWHDGSPAHGTSGTRVPLALTSGRAVLTFASPHGDAAGVRLVLDSGATDLVVFSDSHLAARATPGGVVRLRGLTGARLARTVRLDAIDLGNGRRDGPSAIVIDRPSAWVGQEDGLLPLTSLAAILVDAPGRSATLIPR